FFFFSSRRRHTRFSRDWSSDVCSSDLEAAKIDGCTISSLLTRIVVPIAKPGLVVTGTIAFLMAFGEFVYAVSFITREAMYPISEIGRASCRERVGMAEGAGTVTDGEEQ